MFSSDRDGNRDMEICLIFSRALTHDVGIFSSRDLEFVFVFDCEMQLKTEN